MGVLVDNPLLVLFLVVAAGAAVGRVRIRGVGLGPAAALFVGLAVSAWNADLADLPAIIPEFGLVLFIYTIGLASGPAFVAGIRRDGFRIVVGVLVLFALIGSGFRSYRERKRAANGPPEPEISPPSSTVDGVH